MGVFSKPHVPQGFPSEGNVYISLRAFPYRRRIEVIFCSRDNHDALFGSFVCRVNFGEMSELTLDDELQNAFEILPLSLIVT